MKILILPLLLFAATSALSVEPEKLLESLRSELRDELKAERKEKGASDSPRVSRIESFLMVLATSETLRDERMPQTIQSLEQLQATSLSEKVGGLCKDLITELRGRSEKKAKELRENFENTMRSALVDGLKATTAKDLDAPLAALAKLQKGILNYDYRDGRSGLNTEALSAVEQILTAIQDGLIAKNGVQGQRNKNPVENLKSAARYSARLNDIMPRSEFLEKIQAVVERVSPNQPQRVLTRQEFEKRVQTLVEGVKKLEELDQVVSKISEMTNEQRENEGYSSESGVISQLRSYQRTYEELRAGNAVSMSFASNSYSPQGSESLNGIKNLLVKFALTRVLGVSGELSPKEDETVPTYLNRALETARSTSNWSLMAHTLEAAQAMNLTSVASTNDTSALRQFLGGLNQENAHQFSGAVVSYIAALKSGSQIIPVSKIGELLDALKKEHPEDYEIGVKISSTGASYADERMVRMMSSMPPQLRSSVSGQPQRPDTLFVPPAPKNKPAPEKGTVKPAEFASPTIEEKKAP